MKKKIWLFLVVVGVIIVNIGAFTIIYYLNQPLELKDMEFVAYNNEDNTYTIKLHKKENFGANENFNCLAKLDDEEITSAGQNNECLLTLPLNKDYEIFLKQNGKESSVYHVLDYISNILDFSFVYPKMYLYVGEDDEILYEDNLLINNDMDYEFVSSDTNVLEIDGKTMIGKADGIVTISSSKMESTLTVVVTDLIDEQKYQSEYKEDLPCNYYSLEDATLLDEILAYNIERAGYKTRAGAVEAARFLTMNFKFRIPYFYENGRLHSSGGNYVDGEGRYYKVGMYLHETKMKDIKYVDSGPAIWGCPLDNWVVDTEFGYYYGKPKPNGMDCSGFVSWALLNAGYDPGDLGAGQTDNVYQLPDLGEYVPLNASLFDSDKIKVGDFVSVFGHIGMIIGIDGDDVYVAESLADYGGVVNRKYNKNTINQTFPYVVLMDNYYKNDGNYTIMW